MALLAIRHSLQEKRGGLSALPVTPSRLPGSKFVLAATLGTRRWPANARLALTLTRTPSACAMTGGARHALCSVVSSTRDITHVCTEPGHPAVRDATRATR